MTRPQFYTTNRQAGGAGHGDVQEGTRPRASRYIDQHGQPRIDILEPGRWTEAKELQIEAVNQLWTTLGEDHPSTVVAIANLALFHEERTALAPSRGTNDQMVRMRDRILQSAASWSSGQGKDSQERLESSQKQVIEHSDEITDEERLQLARSMSLGQTTITI